MCTPTAKRGSLQVSDEIAERWKNSKSRKQLIVALINCKGDKASLRQIYVVSMSFDLPLATTCMRNGASQDSFNQKMELVIRNIKEGKVVIDSGYYTEAAMKSELKFDKQLAIHDYKLLRSLLNPKPQNPKHPMILLQPRDRVKAVIAYCTANRARRRALTRPLGRLC